MAVAGLDLRLQAEPHPISVVMAGLAALSMDRMHSYQAAAGLVEHLVAMVLLAPLRPHTSSVVVVAAADLVQLRLHLARERRADIRVVEVVAAQHQMPATIAVLAAMGPMVLSGSPHTSEA